MQRDSCAEQPRYDISRNGRGQEKRDPVTASEELRPRAGKSRRTGAGLQPKGGYALRRMFYSHLAMHGAAAKAIQELAGHEDLSTLQR